MADNHMKHLSLLEKIAETVDPVRSSRHASAIVLKNDIISISTNRIKSHPFQSRFARNPEAIFMHAEVGAIHKALKKISLKDLEKSSLYVLRVKRFNINSDFIWGNSRPCSGCSMCLAEFGIKNVIYSTSSENIHEKNYDIL